MEKTGPDHRDANYTEHKGVIPIWPVVVLLLCPAGLETDGETEKDNCNDVQEQDDKANSGTGSTLFGRYANLGAVEGHGNNQPLERRK